MAYQNSYNPDALPAHVQPDEAAQMLAYTNRPPVASAAPAPAPASSTPSSTTPSQTPSYQNKPPPPIPQSLQQLQPQAPYQRHSPNHSNASSYNSHSHSPSPSGPLSPPPQSYRPHSPQMQPFNPSPNLKPLHASTPPRTVGTDPSLFPLFKAVDKRGVGQLTEEELRAALVNGDFTSFDPMTVRMMIRMFDHDRSGSIGFEEFCGLWGFLAAWRALFDGFDEDRSGTISYDEYSKALLAFGYHLSPSFVLMMYRLYDRRNTNSMSFDIFVQSCISLKRMTDVFKKYDTDRDGYITLSFEEFLTEILQQR